MTNGIHKEEFPLIEAIAQLNVHIDRIKLPNESAQLIVLRLIEEIRLANITAQMILRIQESE